jgi:hypothetical protein
LTKALETIIAEDNGASLCQRIAELEAEKDTLQCAVDNGIEDYDMLLEGNKSLLAEHDDIRFYCEDLQAELAEVCSDAKKQIADLEAKVESAETDSINVAAAGERRLKNFEDELIRDLAELCVLYVHNAQDIGAYARRCPRVSLRLQIIFDDYPQRYPVSHICSAALMRILLPPQSKVPSLWLAILLI